MSAVNMLALTEDFLRERDRVVARLNGATQRHWVSSAAAAHACSHALRDIDLALGAPGPRDVPVIADHAAGAQVMVISTDLMRTARHHHDGAPSLARATDLLADLRRALA